ncbi:MAG: cytochrome c [Burkholderiaceae bacterium]
MHPALVRPAGLATLAVLLGALGSAPARAGIAEGRQKAQLCATCHGPLGRAAMPNTPHLAAQPAQYVSDQLKAYRSGKRNHEIMTLIAKPLTDAEIADLAAWYESLQIEVQPVP